MRIRIKNIQELKESGERIACLTAYDFPTAKLADSSGVSLILVGDSVGNVVLGHESTIPVTMEDILHHTKAVIRGASKALVISDMPFLTYQAGIDDAVRNAGRLIQEGGAQGVKVEGGRPITSIVERIVELGIPVMGHLGLTPQSVNQLSGYRIQAKTLEDATTLIEDAKALEKAGAFAIVLETVPAEVASAVTAAVSIPTIGIGAGVGCSGEIQIIHELLGLVEGRIRKHSRVYADVKQISQKALREYVDDVKNGSFPGSDQTFYLDPNLSTEFSKTIGSFPEKTT